MTIRFFKNVKTVAELRKEYVRLLKINHPDNGGSKETCQEINAEYDYLLGRLPKDNTGKTASNSAEAKKDFQIDKEIRDILNKIIRFDGLNIEIVGSWIWVDGDSYQWKEQLKEIGFQWSRARKKWHYTPYESKWHKGGKEDFETLRNKYGSTTIESEKVARIA